MPWVRYNQKTGRFRTREMEQICAVANRMIEETGYLGSLYLGSLVIKRKRAAEHEELCVGSYTPLRDDLPARGGSGRRRRA